MSQVKPSAFWYVEEAVDIEVAICQLPFDGSFDRTQALNLLGKTLSDAFV